MPMTVTPRQIVDARDALMSLSQQKLNIKLSYNVSKLIRKANEELECLTKARQNIINQYVPEGTEMTPELNQTVMDALNEILDVEVEIPVGKIDLSNISNFEISARDIAVLDPFCIFETIELE